MKRIIALYGRSECGKTTSLNYLRDLLRVNGVSLSSNPPYIGDKCETFLYKDMIVCVCPGGDTEVVIDKNFKYAISKNADVVITASRTKQGPAAKVNEYANLFGLQAEWYKKFKEELLSAATWDLINKEYAQVLFRKL